MTEHDHFTVWQFEDDRGVQWSAMCICGEGLFDSFKTLGEALDAAKAHYETTTETGAE